ncbi:DNA-binding LacI/PurR family transcriptional regulator [Agromyces flavus]|uniref:DNA-binding LacI/PurR family transcriptional regulator n=2 Tax=Agromyces flavus TaxID=589382 RepID=A0A1H1VIF9_9MICO|nr:LacI family DNA-binding transcriptional regulator [Agromyces flavus]MCP2365941.1 DNA-binding LacI/PurR family transcriptional regulator [Agromyces flavus]GGI43687.1 LacI family transcriptional regulator [Agromyces flavus]SDS84485.1 DNA-binding transcriptional regulator, LacI/PurR family [Agromyces flavus]
MAKIHEVAEAAGVSISTVSYALSGKRSISPDTRRRIEEAARALDYRPNAGARMLAGRRTQIFALTEPFRADTHAPAHMAFVLATSIAARRYEYDILLLTEEEASAGMRRVASSGLADGVLVLDVAPDDERVALARRISLPTVFIGVPDDHEGLVCVDLDFESAAALAIDRLAGLGHRSIGFIGHPPTSYEKSNFPPRVRKGIEMRAAELGLALETLLPEGDGPRRTPIRAAVRALVEGGATALVLHCDDTSHAVALDELATLGRRVPEDVSIVSVGATFDTSAFQPPIDSIPLVPSASCELAVELAMRLVEGEDVPAGVRLIAPEYREHGSTAPPPRAG